MANILMVTTRLPWPLDDGYALRVFELARHLDPEHNCHLACEPQRTTELAKLEEFDVFRTMLENQAGEHGARMTAMDAATKNTNDLITSLTLEFNKARQAQITAELVEIVSGAEAL